MSKPAAVHKTPVTVKVSSRHQISLPSVARQELGIHAGDRLLVDVQDGVLILLPEPDDYVEHMAGLHQEIWKNIDTDQYLREERASWTNSNQD